MASVRPPDRAPRLREAFDCHWSGADPLSGNNPLRRAAGVALTASGELPRGRMLLEVCAAPGGTYEQAFPATVAIEYLHLGTLLHDDLSDCDKPRPCGPTSWKHCGALCGDFPSVAAFHMNACVLDILSAACMDLCPTWAREEEMAGQCSTGDGQYLQNGALPGGNNEQQVGAEGALAEHPGITCQPIDDRLPFTGESQVIGKAITGDIRNHRATAPVPFARAALFNDRQSLRTIVEKGRPDGQLGEASLLLREIFTHTGALKEGEGGHVYSYLAVQQKTPFLPTTDANAGLPWRISLCTARDRRS